jgi:hypothetical protein
MESNADAMLEPLAKAQDNWSRASREYASQIRCLARKLATFMLRHGIQVTLLSGVHYRAMRLTWGARHCDGTFCRMPFKPEAFLLREGRILNNERRPWVCQHDKSLEHSFLDDKVKHNPSFAIYVEPSDSDNHQVAKVAGFDEMDEFLDEIQDVARLCSDQLDVKSARLRERSVRAVEVVLPT